jgi:hypothetical protein
MTQDRKLSTSDIADAAERVERRPEHDEPIDQDRPRPVESTSSPLFAPGDADAYRTQWSAIQTGFVDEPRRAVAEADGLVADVMKRLAEVFADERRQLESRWEHTEKVSTEELRQAMQRYRSFFERLLSV